MRGREEGEGRQEESGRRRENQHKLLLHVLQSITKQTIWMFLSIVVYGMLVLHDLFLIGAARFICRSVTTLLIMQKFSVSQRVNAQQCMSIQWNTHVFHIFSNNMLSLIPRPPILLKSISTSCACGCMVLVQDRHYTILRIRLAVHLDLIMGSFSLTVSVKFSIIDWKHFAIKMISWSRPTTKI